MATRTVPYRKQVQNFNHCITLSPLKNLIFIALLLSGIHPRTFAQNDLPAASAHPESIKAGSFIIAMDTAYQKLPGYFNMKAYGLVNALLQNEIPVKWAIKAGKNRTASGSIDFSSSVTRIFPDTLSMGNISFRSSAIIIDSSWVDKALPVISAFGNNVCVYLMQHSATIDISYTLTHKPRILLLNSSGYDTIAVHMLQEAGFNTGSYTLQSPAGTPFNPSGNWSLISETHWHTSDTARINPLLRYGVQRGANLIMNCVSIRSIENSTLTMTTAGIDCVFTGWAGPAFNNHDVAIAQFIGNIATPNGDLKHWKEKPGSVLRANAYEIMRGSAGNRLYCMAGMKMRSNTLPGGNLFYVSGHDHFYWTAPGTINDPARINGRRIFMNAIFIPVSDSIDGIDFKTDVVISKFTQAGFAVKNEPFKIYIVAKNEGRGRAKPVHVKAALPAGLLYASHVSTNGNFDPVSGNWDMDSLQRGESDTLIITAVINALGTITYTSTVSTHSYEPDLSDNTTTLSLFGVSRPVAINDTMQFIAPLFQDYPVKFNDTDEDGGPFSTATVLAGPYSGSAQVINGDSIRYTIAANFSGRDSLRYLSCDNHPLCDTAWFFIVINSPLPVTLATFTGTRGEEQVTLNWITLNEKNNSHFEIERSSDGFDFKKQDIVHGKGHSNKPSFYEYYEENTEDPILYYRLTQVDFDGKSSTSKIIALERKGNKGFNITLYPNPSNGSFQVIKGEGIAGKLDYTLSDASGRVISTRTWMAGSDGFLHEPLANNMPLAPGYYLAKFNTENNFKCIKLIVK